MPRSQSAKDPENFRLLVNIPVTFRLISTEEEGNIETVLRQEEKGRTAASF